jgi:hypothetical protein
MPATLRMRFSITALGWFVNSSLINTPSSACFWTGHCAVLPSRTFLNQCPLKPSHCTDDLEHESAGSATASCGLLEVRTNQANKIFCQLYGGHCVLFVG